MNKRLVLMSVLIFAALLVNSSVATAKYYIKLHKKPSIKANPLSHINGKMPKRLHNNKKQPRVPSSILGGKRG